jgi:hypothetical protein
MGDSFLQISTALGGKMFGFISNMAVTRIAEEKLLQENEKIQDLSSSITWRGGQNKHLQLKRQHYS